MHAETIVLPDTARAGSPRPQQRSSRSRVLTIVPDIERGGGQRMAVDLMCGLDKRCFEVAGISFFGPTGCPLEEELRSAGVTMHYFGKRVGFDARVFRSIHRVIESFRPHIVHTHLGVLRYALPALLLHRVPAAFHTMHRIADRDRGTLDRWINTLAFYTHVQPVAIAGAVQHSLKRVYKLRSCPLIPNGIPVERFESSWSARVKWREENGFNAADVLFVCVARLEPIKNHRMLLEAFALGPARNSHARLVLAGAGELEHELRSRAKRLRIDGQVVMLQHRTDVPELLGAADVFVLSSFSEANPLSVMEAMAAGLPVVATAVGGIPELVRNGVDGLLTPNNDANAMGQAMLRLLADDPMRRRMAENAAKRSSAEFGRDAMVARYAALYDGSYA